ncbi:MAG TPA: biotin/lipoyl-containing protein, partial [Spirochaetia bacterium]|nr:biotin/lipoyl-containing protein [Spirochaetia bacterium]
MIKEIQLPEIAENVTDGVVTTVLVSEGDEIAAEQSILEMETDKASVEVPAPFGGTVTEILVSDGDEISVGQVVMKVEAEEGEPSATKARGQSEPKEGGDDEDGGQGAEDEPAAEDEPGARGRDEDRRRAPQAKAKSGEASDV